MKGDPHDSERSAFSVVLPVFDEEQVLRVLLDGLRSVLKDADRRYEIIVVDDGSQARLGLETSSTCLDDARMWSARDPPAPAAG